MMNKQEIIKEGLNELYPNPKCELNYTKDYELLISVMLSAQTTDKRVNEVTNILYKDCDTLEKLNSLTLKEIENYIKSIGMYRTKAKNLKSIVSEIINIGYVPNNREYLENLPGVGRKTTNVVLSNLYNEPCIAVDTHVSRVSKRLGLAKNTDDVSVIEQKLMKKFPKKDWSRLHHQLVLFGRYNCKAKNPECNNCKFTTICKYYKKLSN